MVSPTTVQLANGNTDFGSGTFSAGQDYIVEYPSPPLISSEVKLNFNVHYGDVHYGDTNHQTGPHTFSGDLTQWHIYGCELSSEGVTFYLDGKVTKKLTGEYVRSKYPHRLGIQLDVDRTGRTGPDTDMLIDWVRVSNVR